jgi:HlyD family secretion protein
MLKKVLSILIVLVLFVGLSLYFFKKQEKPRGLLILHGRVEGKEINIGSKVQGRIIRLYKRESRPCEEGGASC